jgi:hypothetical protein
MILTFIGWIWERVPEKAPSGTISQWCRSVLLGTI